MTAKKYTVHYLVEDYEDIVALNADEAATMIMEEYGPQTRIVSVVLADDEQDDDPPEDFEDEDDGYGHAV